MVSVVAGNGGLEKVILKHESGVSAEVYLWGATLTSYKTADGIERIFVSPGALFDGKKAIRGGVPVVFPQFGQPDKAMPQHGFARVSLWALSAQSETAEEVSAIFSLGDSETTRAMWPHAFHLQYTVTLKKSHINLDLRVKNTDAAAFDFHALLHTYFSIPDVADVFVVGLKGRTIIDKVAGGDNKVEDSEAVTLPGFTDRVYVGAVPGNARARVDANGKALFILSNWANLAGELQPCDVVLWNPFEEASPGDLPPPAYKNFVCVEPGLVAASHNLAKGKFAEIKQSIQAY